MNNDFEQWLKYWNYRFLSAKPPVTKYEAMIALYELEALLSNSFDNQRWKAEYNTQFGIHKMVSVLHDIVDR
ncbi:MAG: hypothetical protein ACRDF4_09505 [Rhabdochlamydiaceae bacterium]